MKEKLFLIGLNFAHQHYFSLHKEVLSNDYDIIEIKLDEDPIIGRFFNRRSILTLPAEIIFLFFKTLRSRPKVIISAGPKSGLISATVGIIFPNIRTLHWFTGQVWATKRKFRLSAGYWVDRFIATVANATVCDGPSQQHFINTNLNSKNKTDVLVPGSINGIEDKYYCAKKTKSKSDILRLCFVGRKATEKGIEELVEIASTCARYGVEIHVLLAGPLDLSFPNFEAFQTSALANTNNIEFINEYVNPIDVFEKCDVFILLSQREGFSGVVIQAQAAGLPVICSDIYGLKDTFIEGETGFGVPYDDKEKCISAIKMLSDETLRKKMSENSIEFSQRFRQDRIKTSLQSCYWKLGIIL